jgi:AcrR family transcriptional regulator
MTAAEPLAVEGSPVVDIEATRRRLSTRQAEVVAKLVRAAGEETEEAGYDGLTVRGVAKRAGVAPATAYTYFSSKDHLLAEVLWRRMEALAPVDTDDSVPMSERIARTVRDMIPFADGSPTLIDACTVALVSSNPGVDPRVVRVLEACYSGALLTAGTGHRSFLDIPTFVADAATLLAAGADSSATPSKGAGR